MLHGDQDPRLIVRDQLLRGLSIPGWRVIIHRGEWLALGARTSIKHEDVVEEIYGSDSAMAGDLGGALCLPIMCITKRLNDPGSYQLWEFIPGDGLVGGHLGEIDQLLIVIYAAEMLAALGGHELHVPTRIEVDADDFEIEGLTVSSMANKTLIRIMPPAVACCAIAE